MARALRASAIRTFVFRSSRSVCRVGDVGAVGLGSDVVGVEGAVGGVEARHEGAKAGNHAGHEGDVEGCLGPDVEVGEGEGGVGGEVVPGEADDADD